MENILVNARLNVKMACHICSHLDTKSQPLVFVLVDSVWLKVSIQFHPKGDQWCSGVGFVKADKLFLTLWILLCEY